MDRQRSSSASGAVDLMRTAAALVVALLLGPGPRAGAQEVKVYFGNLHSHTGYSDGDNTVTPRDAYAKARAEGLDFLAVTDHNHTRCEQGATPDRRDGVMIGVDPGLYTGPGDEATIPVADALNEDGRFVTIYGQEFSSISKGNHINVFDVADVINDREIPNGEFGKLVVDWLPAHPASNGRPAMIQLNHPFFRGRDHYELEYGRDDFGSDEAWIARIGALARTIELLNGPGTSSPRPGAGVEGVRPEQVAEAQYLKFLNLGFHVAPTGDQDNHYLNEGTETEARTGLLADGLTRAKLLAAIDARHVYATEDRNLRVIVRVNGHLCGDRLSAPDVGSALKVEYHIADDGEDAGATYQIDVFSGIVRGGLAQVVETVRAEGDAVDGTIDDLTYAGGPRYFFFRVTQMPEGQETTDYQRAWTAPVWFDADDSGPSALAALAAGPGVPADEGGIDVAKLVASRRSRSYHLSLECLDAQKIKPSNLVRGAEARVGRTLHTGCPRKVE